MKFKVLFIIGLLTATITQAEIIDGPANIRETINGKPRFSLENGVEVECEDDINGWHVIGFTAKVPEDLKDWVLPKGFELYSYDGKYIGKTLALVEFSAMDGDCAILTGYTYKSNIVESSKIESKVGKLITPNEIMNLSDFEEHIKKYNYQDDNQFDWGMTYIYYETWISDPSPGARIRLIFENNILIGIIHTRDIKIDGYQDYDMKWGWSLLTNLDNNDSRITTIVDGYKFFLSQVD